MRVDCGSGDGGGGGGGVLLYVSVCLSVCLCWTTVTAVSQTSLVTSSTLREPWRNSTPTPTRSGICQGYGVLLVVVVVVIIVVVDDELVGMFEVLVVAICEGKGDADGLWEWW